MAKKPQAVIPSELTMAFMEPAKLSLEGTLIPEERMEAIHEALYSDVDIIDNERRLDAIEEYLVDLHKAMGHIGIPQFVPAKTGDSE
jgi:hypothetical protein